MDFTFSLWRARGHVIVDATPAAIQDIADLLAAAGGTVAVVRVASSSFFHDDNVTRWSPSEIAAAQDVRATVHDFGGLADGLNISREGLVLAAEDLAAFVTGWTPDHLTLVGLLNAPTRERLDEIALAVGTDDRDGRLLPTLPDVTFWYAGHDDHYLWLESTDEAFGAALLARLLANNAGLAHETVDPVAVAEPDDAAVRDLLARSEYWAGFWVTQSPTTVSIGLSAVSAPPRSWDPRPERFDLLVTYDLESRTWRFAPG
ncbi:hypothetical protein O7635_00955 [Asanoa sp. WMMD1127]|uniref:hypothetical protein n=1 Tax=Asanoa sp. WMMD1127 TaxID=3016107 RepID=UPI002415EE6F|nr:hypothetical protein [Asanoa sp. WMMD1127]MDG4820420.1 hypothetical protein [Asanoa sp. WMMD1127]